MTEMSSYLHKLAAWHEEQRKAAEERLKRASTHDCITANKKTAHFHSTATVALSNLCLALGTIERTKDFVQGS